MRGLLVGLGCLGAAAASPAANWTYTYAPGAISAGNDVVPPANMTLPAAEAQCTAEPRCRGITYHGPNTSTTVQKIYFKSSTGHSSDQSWSTFVKTGTVTPPLPSIKVGGASNLMFELREQFYTSEPHPPRPPPPSLLPSTTTPCSLQFGAF